MKKEMMREEYTRICESIFDLLMSGISETAPVIVDLREAATQLAEELGISEN